MSDTTRDGGPPADHVAHDATGGPETTERAAIEEHLKAKSTWLRLVFMLIFYVLASVTTLVASVVVVLGFLWVLFTGETNERLRSAGHGIARYLYEIVQYLTYNSDVRPFPFDAEWPSAQPDTNKAESS